MVSIMANQEGHSKNMAKTKPAPKALPAPKKGPAVPPKLPPAPAPKPQAPPAPKPAPAVPAKKAPAKKKAAKPSSTPKPPVVLPSKSKPVAPAKSCWWPIIRGILGGILALIIGFIIGTLIIAMLSLWGSCYTSWCSEVDAKNENKQSIVNGIGAHHNTNIINNINMNIFVAPKAHCSGGRSEKSDRIVLKDMSDDSARIIPAGPMVPVTSQAQAIVITAEARPNVINLEPCSQHCVIRKAISPLGNTVFMIPVGWTVVPRIMAPQSTYQRLDNGAFGGHAAGEYIQIKNLTGTPLNVEFECFPAQPRRQGWFGR